MYKSHPYNIERKNAYLKTYNFIKENPSDKPLIIVADLYKCPYKEYALCFGLYWAGEIMQPKYIPILNKMYPNTYIYYGWDKLFHDWSGNAYTYIELLKKHNNIRLFSGGENIENDLLKFNMYNLLRMFDTKIKMIYSNENTNEKIYDITYDPSIKFKTIRMLCNADSLSTDKKNFIGENEQYIGNGMTQNSERSFSGKYSCKLTKEKQYGMTFNIGVVKQGEQYKFSVWRYNGNKNASLIIAAKDMNDFYFSRKISNRSENEWDELVFEMVITKNLDNKELIIYVYNDTEIPAYFDDLEIIYTPLITSDAINDSSLIDKDFSVFCMNKEDKIKDYINKMEKDENWLNKIKDKAAKNNISVEEQKLIDAEYLYKEEIKSNKDILNKKEERLKEIKQEIINTPEWLKQIKKKAI